MDITRHIVNILIQMNGFAFQIHCKLRIESFMTILISYFITDFSRCSKFIAVNDINPLFYPQGLKVFKVKSGLR